MFTSIMAALHRAMITWFLLLIFFILFVLQADETIRLSWFLIFIPLWVLDAAVIIYIIVNIVQHFQSPYFGHHLDMTYKKKSALLLCCLIKMVFQILVCLRLEEFPIKIYYVLIPLWLLLIVGLVENFRVLISKPDT